MLIPKEAECLKFVVPKHNESYYSLCNVLVDEGRLVATDEEALYVYNLDTPDEDEFPTYPAIEETDGLELPALIPKAAFEKAMKNIPKKTNLSILQHTQLVQKDNVHMLLSTDLETWDNVSFTRIKDIRYPDVQAIIDWGDDVDDAPTVALGVAKLEQLLKIAKSQKSDYVQLTLPQNDDGKVGMVLMQMFWHCFQQGTGQMESFNPEGINLHFLFYLKLVNCKTFFFFFQNKLYVAHKNMCTHKLACMQAHMHTRAHMHTHTHTHMHTRVF